MRAVALLFLAGIPISGLSACDGPTDPPRPPEPGSITLDPRQPTLTSIGDSVTLAALVRDTAGMVIDGAPVYWSASSPDVVSVVGGVLVARGNGAAVVTARAGSVTDTTTVTVSQEPASIAFVVQPSEVLQGRVISPAVEVVVRDGRGHAITAGPELLELSLSPATGVLGGTPTASLGDGSLGFDDLSVAEAGRGYRLVAEVGEVAVYSGFFDVHLAFAELSSGGVHTCGRTVDGAVYCWGHNAGGRVGDGTTENRNTPVLVAAAGSLVSVDAGAPATWGLDGAGQAFGWGNGALLPTLLDSPVSYATLTTRWHTCAIAADGTAYCWDGAPAAFGGGNIYAPVSEPTLAMEGEPYLALATGSYFTCGIAAVDATAWCAGNNPSGELGNGTYAFSVAVTPVVGGMTFSALDAGHEFVCGITVDGPTYCWGQNQHRQLGNAAAGDTSAVPVLVDGGHTFIELSLGGTHACGLTAEGQAFCWGSSDFGMLGVDAIAASATPLAAAGELRFSTLSAGGFHTCGIAQEGYTYCWGDDLNGALGNGGVSAGATPTRIAPPWL